MPPPPPPPPPPTTNPQLSAPHKPTPVFSPPAVSVVFVLGGPGAGKGTQCAYLVRDYGFRHLSAGDLLRAEQDRPGSEFGDMIREHIRSGQIVPMEVTVQLLENAMTETVEANTKNTTKDGGEGEPRSKFLVDGFPRKMDQAFAFEDKVCRSAFTLFFDCPEDEMQKRLLKRGETSGRADDNADSIRKRFKTFVETSMPVVQHFEGEGRVERISATKSPEEVYADVKAAMERRGIAEVEKKAE